MTTWLHFDISIDARPWRTWIHELHNEQFGDGVTGLSNCVFPFGAAHTGTLPAMPSRTPADAFIVGVYPSAVHARWTVDGQLMCGALAIAPEPYSFWDGHDARERVEDIARRIPCEAGQLTCTGNANGRSGKAVQRYYLEPLGLSSDRCWMTDLDEHYYVPHEPKGRKDNATRTQRDALNAYERFRKNRCPELPAATLPDRPLPVGASGERLAQLERQLRESGAKVVITLGAEPIPFVAPEVPLEKNDERYGRAVGVQLWGVDVLLLRLCHPRHAGGLGAHSGEWKQIHTTWSRRVARNGGLSAVMCAGDIL